LKIIQNDPIHCSVVPPIEINKIKKVFEYPSECWIQGAFKKQQKCTTSLMANHPHKGWFLAGSLSAVKKYCEINAIPLEIEQYVPEPIKMIPATLPGITFREDQKNAIDAVVKQSRGIIKAPTGSGKTVMAGGIISMYPDSKSIVIVHTKSLFQQTVEELKKWFGEAVGGIGSGKYEPNKITVCMIQTVNKILINKKSENYEKFTDLLADVDVVIIDEAHHLAKDQGHYVELMLYCLAPIRIGLTATPNPKNKTKERLVGEGHLGPIMGELTVEKGIESGILAQPRLKLIPVPKNITVKSKKYADIYRDCIVLNKTRNRLIAKEASDTIRAGKSVLIMISDIVNKHAETIRDLMIDLYDTDSLIVTGATDNDLREQIKSTLKTKDILCVIVTSVWREGINIPSLDCIINAIGGKSDIMVLQVAGRGLRTAEGKEEILIVDFLDPYQFLAQHSIERLRIYNDMGILNK
jgi:superfamily II DNA or RNA helicase